MPVRNRYVVHGTVGSVYCTRHMARLESRHKLRRDLRRVLWRRENKGTWRQPVRKIERARALNDYRKRPWKKNGLFDRNNGPFQNKAIRKRFLNFSLFVTNTIDFNRSLGARYDRKEIRSMTRRAATTAVLCHFKTEPPVNTGRAKHRVSTTRTRIHFNGSNLVNVVYRIFFFFYRTSNVISYSLCLLK